MAKQAEIDYVKNMPAGGIEHALNKPFSDPHCANYLMELGAVMALLPPAPSRLLDLGCGTGWTSCFLAKHGYQVTGQDIAPDMIHYANVNRDREQLETLNFIVSDYESMTFEQEFDAAVFFDSLHHAEDEVQALQRVYQALKPGGLCVTSEPGVGHSRSPASIAAMQQYHVTERDMPPFKIIQAGKQVGFRTARIYPHAHHLNLIYRRTNNRLLKTLLQVPLFSPIVIAGIAAIYKQFNGIVVLQK
jgi:2-polyprenyl-3-methyl-5-hydroxy-6-metoxy-1,4-benzoquinol methylase